MNQTTSHPPPPKRVIAYIDGFNLCFGMKESGWCRYYWLDVYRLVERICPPNAIVVGVKYFTARITSSQGKQKRQTVYLEALESSTKCQIILGNFLNESIYCSTCAEEYIVPKEKMTDVNIAVEMMTDAFQDNFDMAMLISGDSDLAPPVTAVRRLFPEKPVIISFPPKRNSKELKQCASGNFVITRANLRDSQLDDEITSTNGSVLKCPSRWKDTSEVEK